VGRMGTMRNRYGDEIVALDTPDTRMAVELRSHSFGSARHVILNVDGSASFQRGRLSSGRSRHAHSCCLDTSDTDENISDATSEDKELSTGSSGGAISPVRMLVAVFQESSEPVVIASFMHLEETVILQLVVGPSALKEALLRNERVCLYVICRILVPDK
jgi:hypothetical protein